MFREPTNLDQQQAAVNSSSQHGTIAELFYLLDMDGNGDLSLEVRHMAVPIVILDGRSSVSFTDLEISWWSFLNSGKIAAAV